MKAGVMSIEKLTRAQEIGRDAAKRLANLGGSQPGIKGARRRRQDVE